MKLTNENYYSAAANYEYAGYSQLKSFSRCEAKFMAELTGEYGDDSNTALLVGSYVDAWLDGDRALGELLVSHPEMFKRDGTLKAEFVQAEEICKRIASDPVMMNNLRIGKRQVIMTGMIAGVPVKIKVDCLHKDRIDDGKVMRDVEDVWDETEHAWVPWWRYYRYDWQAYCYQTIVQQNTGKLLPFFNDVATKQKGIDLRVFKYTDDTIRNAGEEVRALLPRLQAVKQGKVKPTACGHCDYCRAMRKLERDVYEEV